MTSGDKICEALKAILDDLNENINKQTNIEALEEENKQLHQKKMEMIAEMNKPLTFANASLVLVEDVIIRQGNSIHHRLESKQKSIIRLKNRSCESLSEISSLKKRLREDGNFMVLPYHNVLTKIKELEEKTAKDRALIKELTQQHTHLIQNERNLVDQAEDIRFIEMLRSIAEEQRKHIEKLRDSRRV